MQIFYIYSKPERAYLIYFIFNLDSCYVTESFPEKYNGCKELIAARHVTEGLLIMLTKELY